MATHQLIILLATLVVSLVSTQTYYIVPDHTYCPTETTPINSGSLPVTFSDHTPLNISNENYNNSTLSGSGSFSHYLNENTDNHDPLLDKVCFTLTQYAQFPATTIYSNVILIFEPGNHTLNSRLHIQNVGNLVLQVANSSLRSVAIVTCTNSSGFDLATISEVSVSGLEFIDCRENSVKSVDQLNMEDCRFQGGHGMELRNVSSATFEKSSFILLTSFSEAWDPWQKQYAPSGGAIAAFSSDINVTECLFVLNSAYCGYGHYGHGGAIWSDAGSISIHGSEISSNIAIGGGAIGTVSGSISIRGSDFSSNTAIIVGGAVWTINGSIIIHGSDFSSNIANVLGGAILTFISGNISIYGSDFSNNRAGDISGGAIWIDSGSISIYGSDFSNNRAGDSGGAIWTASGSISIYGSEFSSNTAGNSGGAALTFNGNITIHGSDFSSNTAMWGGAIQTDNGSVSIYDSDFSNNTAGNSGGAMATHSGNISIYGSDCCNNRAMWGGAIRTLSDSMISIHDSYFSSNTAGDDGGAIIAERGSILINSSNFSNNSATNDGGAIETYNSSISIRDSVFIRNTADSLGGAIRIRSGNIDIHSACDFTNNRADRDGGAILSDSGSITINGSSFFDNSVATDGGAIWTKNGNISIQDSNLQNNIADRDGGAIWTNSGNLDVHDSEFSSNSVGTDGGAIGTDRGSITIHGCNLNSNTAGTDGGAIWTDSGSISIDSQCEFSNNRAATDGGAIWTARGSISIHSSNFSNNIANSGGVIRTDSGNISIHYGVFIRNIALNDGGVLFLGSAPDSVNEINNSKFNHNHAADQGGVIYVRSRTISLTGLLQIKNNSAMTGVVYAALKSTLELFGNTTISDNRASIYTIQSIVRFYGHTNIVNNSHSNDTALIEGGAITASQQSDISFNGVVYILNNAVINGHGGAILLRGSTIHTHKNTTIAHNTALSGGAIYAYQSTLNFTGTTTISENIAITKGGGIYASSSEVIIAGGQLEFIKNRAEEGGGICLETHSRLHLKKGISECFTNESGNDCMNQSLPNLGVYFTNNSAAYGGALFISDETSTCDNQPFSRECFLQEIVSHIQDSKLLIVQNIYFEGNSANMSGGAIYGGLLDRCIISPEAQAKYQNGPQLDAISFLTNITNLEESDVLSEISSETVGLCFCGENNEPDCGKYTPANKVWPKKGETFSIFFVAVNHVNKPVEASVRVSLSPQGDLVKGQDIQHTTSNCTQLNFTITSKSDEVELVLDAGGPCSYHKVVNVTFAPCNCPIGFVRTDDDSNCSCKCDPCLYPHYIDGCSSSNSSVLRKDNIWISSVSYRNISHNECLYLTYPHCPFDYCNSSRSPVWIDLNLPNGSDSQCAFNRSGKLCGSCKDGLSLSLGSSRCLHCSNNWLALLIVFALAGVALVAFLLVFNLTVAVGTINGLIFYANILTTNRAIFFPFQSPNFFTVLIAWLNLDFGFENCFFDGMNGYVKEWLQLAFPIYIIFLVSMVIIGCEYSTRIARLFTKTNPVATLATLILLSYAKSLRVIIAAFSPAKLENPDGSKEILWLIDGNIRYLEGKHIPLFLVALLILLMGTVFTSFLFSYQWLLRCPNRMVKLIKNARLYPFMDAYLAPYNINHRYWTGLLLLIRAFLYIVAAININGDPGNNIMAIYCTLISLQIVKTFLPGRVYKSWLLDAMNFSFIINLIFFSFGSLYIRKSGEGNQKSLAYTSTSIAFITFLAILTYHTYAFVLPRKKRIKLDSFILKMKFRLTKQESTNHEIILVPRPIVTYSVVDPVPTSQQLLENIKKKANAKQKGEVTTILENESATNTELSLASVLPKQTSNDSNNSSRKQMSKSPTQKGLVDETRMDKDKQQKENIYIELEPRASAFSDIPYIRDSDELALERETEINDFIEITD